MTSVLPSGGTSTVVIPSVNNAIGKGSGGPTADKVAIKITTRRRAHSRTRSTTTTAAPVVKTTASSNEDEQEPADNEKAVKAAIKRAIRSILNRQ